MRKLLTTGVLAAAATGSIMAATAPAFAASDGHYSANRGVVVKADQVGIRKVTTFGPNGNGCDLSAYATKVWGWCDGNGPERYAIYAKCSDGRWYESASHPWWGDRRGAWVYCPSGTTLRAFKGDWA